MLFFFWGGGGGERLKILYSRRVFFYIQIFHFFYFYAFSLFYIFYIFRFFHFFTFLHFYNFQIFSLFYIFSFLQFFRGHSSSCFFLCGEKLKKIFFRGVSWSSPNPILLTTHNLKTDWKADALMCLHALAGTSRCLFTRTYIIQIVYYSYSACIALQET